MNEILTQFHFLRPWAFLLFIPTVLIWWLWQRQSDPLQGWRKQIDPDLLKALVVGKGESPGGTKRWLLGIWSLAVVLVAGPTWRLEPSPFAEDAAPLVILLKSDLSMDTPDPAPSRLVRAHLKIADLAGARKGQPLGLIAYAGSAHLVLPPTRDTAVVAEMAVEVSSAIMPVSGDRLDLALREADRVLKRSAGGGSILVVADTIDTDPDALREMARAFGHSIQFLEVLDQGASSNEGNRTAARILGASIVRMSTDDSDIESVVRRAARVPAGLGENESERWEESGYWFLPLLGILLLASFRRKEIREVEA